MAPSQILLRSHKDPFTATSATETYLRNTIGNNVGNLVFSHASHRLLSRKDAVVTSSQGRSGLDDPARASEEFDHFVVPLANAFRPAFHRHLDQLSEYIEGLTVPVTVLGVGAQARINGSTKQIDPMSESVTRFVRAVLDRSASIGVRGEFTRQYLASLGFGDEHVDVIGCPSMFLRGPELTIREQEGPIDAGSRIAVNVSPYVEQMGPILLANAQRYPGLHYFAQDLGTLGLMLGGDFVGAGRQLTQNPVTADHVLYREDRMRFCLDPWTWFDALATYRFSFGTRIHGNISALLAGTPAVVLAHDSRTLELAEYYEIPHRKIGRLSEDVDAARLYAKGDWGPLQAGHAARWETFARFLHRHGLGHAFEDGGDLDGFDARVSATTFPPPVHALPVAERGGRGSWRVRRATRKKLEASARPAAG